MNEEISLYSQAWVWILLMKYFVKPLTAITILGTSRLSRCWSPARLVTRTVIVILGTARTRLHSHCSCTSTLILDTSLVQLNNVMHPHLYHAIPQLQGHSRWVNADVLAQHLFHA